MRQSKQSTLNVLFAYNILAKTCICLLEHDVQKIKDVIWKLTIEENLLMTNKVKTF